MCSCWVYHDNDKAPERRMVHLLYSTQGGIKGDNTETENNTNANTDTRASTSTDTCSSTCASTGASPGPGASTGNNHTEKTKIHRARGERSVHWRMLA